MALSEENKNKIVKTGLYRMIEEPENKNTWCRNWTFRPKFYDDGRVFMYDSFWNSWGGGSFEVTDETLKNLSMIFDFEEVKEISRDEAQEYDYDDVFREAVDSGGIQYYKCYVYKSTEKSKQNQFNILVEEVKSAKWKLEYKTRFLERFIEENPEFGDKPE